jgi:hypothetical protein
VSSQLQLENQRTLSFSQDQDSVAVSFKLRKESSVRTDNANRQTSGIVAILEQYHFSRRPIGIGEGGEISVGGDDGKAVLFCKVPDSASSG